MQRYFSVNKELELSKDDIHHITKVMRMKKDDKIQIVFDKKVFLCNIDNINSDNISYSVVKEIIENNELDVDITIAFALVNETKTDLILQKCTELGAHSFIGVNMKNSKVKLDKKEDKKIERWNKILKEASEQSYRTISPKVEGILSIKELANLPFDKKYVCSTKENEKTIKNVLQCASKYDKIIIVVGPEGGIDEKEEDFLEENGFERITLGNTILRCETAPIFVMSAVRYEFMR